MFRAIPLVRLLAMLASAAALGVWGVLLLAPRPGALPPALGAPAAPRPDNAPVALWFGRDVALDTQVQVQGVIADGRRSAAVISINGAASTAVSTGAQPASGVLVRDIDEQGVTLEVGGAPARAAAPVQNDAPAGIVPVRQ